MPSLRAKEVQIPCGEASLSGILTIPEQARGIILFVHGSGSSRLSPRNQQVARFLQEGNWATLLFDLLTQKEETIDNITRELRFNIPFLAQRLQEAVTWVQQQEGLRSFSIGYFGASTGAAAAIIAAADHPEPVQAIVSRGGRPDLAGQSLVRLRTPTLLIVGGADYGVIELNEKAFSLMTCTKKLEIVPDATHLFEETGGLEHVSKSAHLWFQAHL